MSILVIIGCSKMLRFLAVVFLFAAVNGGVLPEVPQFAMDWDRTGSIVNGKIVGGEDADIRDAPYQVAMLISRSGGTFSLGCGGSIIRAHIISSAAHCPDSTSASQWRVRAGSSLHNEGGQVIDVTRFSMHPEYSRVTIDYDIAMYYLATHIIIDGITTSPIPLPAQDMIVPDDSPSFVTGWGATREGGPIPTILQKVTIPIVNQEECANAYAGFNPITPRMICAGLMETGGQDACQGDSGGPLAINGVIIGITSWGRGCARPGSPGVWVRVPALRTWINSQLWG